MKKQTINVIIDDLNRRIKNNQDSIKHLTEELKKLKKERETETIETYFVGQGIGVSSQYYPDINEKLTKKFKIKLDEATNRLKELEDAKEDFKNNI